MPHIQLNSVKISGFAGSSGEPGQTIKVLIRGGMTSNEPLFHKVMAGISSLAAPKFPQSQINHLLLIVHRDNSADLYLNDFEIHGEMMLKKSVREGEAVFRSDIADWRRIRFPKINLTSTDKVVVCCKIGWKFALFFDFNPDGELKIDELEIGIARLFRYLTFEECYATLSNEDAKNSLIKEGWFPFVELLGDQFDRLAISYSACFSVSGAHQPILSSFYNSRIERLKERWRNSTTLGDRIEILSAGLDSYIRKEPIPCLKIMLTEIEGILREIRKKDTGESDGKLPVLLDYICNRGLTKIGDEASLLFPKEFREYLASVTFQNFDPASVSIAPISRHSAGHGASPASAYTMERALQAILTVDQIAFFL